MKHIYWSYVYLVIWIATILTFGLVTFLNFSEAHADEIGEERIIRQVASEEHFDADLAVAIAKVESKLNPNVVGTQGEIGVFQLKPNYHAVVDGLDTRTNARVAIRYLKVIKERFEPLYGDAYFLFYNVGPYYKKTIRYPRLFPYVVRVRAQERTLAWNQ